jgi:hypothetical protein
LPYDFAWRNNHMGLLGGSAQGNDGAAIMAWSLDEFTFSFKCSKCRQVLRTTVGWLKEQDKSCPGCGAIFNTEACAAPLAEAETALAKFRESLGNLCR